jgi:hypothetical protein
MMNRQHHMLAKLVAFTLVAMLAMIGQTVNGQGPQKIGYGQTVNGEVSDPEDQADYVFQGQKGDSITVAVVRQSGDLEPEITVYGAQGTLGVIGESTPSEDTRSATLTLTLPQTSLYAIAIASVDEETSGKFKLTLIGPGGGNVQATPAATAATTEVPTLLTRYNVAGKDLDGRAYKGALTVTHTRDVYQMEWSVGKLYRGAGILTGNILSVGWGGVVCGVAAFQVQDDGSLDGIWSIAGETNLGTERAARADKPADKSIAGNYTVSGTNLDGTPHTGTLKITRSGEVYQLNWQIDDLADYVGVGLLDDKTLSVGWGLVTDPCRGAAYRVKRDGTLAGRWSAVGKAKIGTEEALKTQN